MMFRRFRTMLLTVSFAMPSLMHAAQSSPSPAVPSSNQTALSPDEIREGILRIEQGILSAREAALLRKAIIDQEGLAERERAIASRELEAERQRAALESQRAETEKARGDFYENAFKTVTKKTSTMCHIARVFTLGLARCGR